MYILPGLLFWCAAIILIYDRTQVHTTIAPLPEPYVYNIRQTADDSVSYRQSSFFGDGPDPSNTAYIADLTDTIDAHFHYSFTGSAATKLSYQYSAMATISATSGNQGSEGGVASVWTKKFDLIKPVSGTKNTKALTLDKDVTIPFAEYKTAMDQFKTAFNATLSGEMVVTYTVHVSGKMHGAPFSDIKTSTISTSLDQPVYQLAVKFNKSDRHEILPIKAQHLADTITRYEMLIAFIMIVLGTSCIIYGFRRQIFKTPYMRELERIYRYHDGIIIRARKQPNLANKNIVPVQSFDDLLNLEEEIKTPIVAAAAGGEATQFMITKDDTVYIYTLGRVTTSNTPPVPIHAAGAPQARKQPDKKIKVSG
jgi:hypothetical protein